MKSVISASRRSDIPAFHLKWFIDHVQKGYVNVPNPFNRKQVKRVSLSPQEVAWIVFWSRNFEVFLKNDRYFEPYDLFFHFTINPQNALLEPDMIAPAEAFKQLEKLASLFGSERIIWRYDPITFYRNGGEILSNHDINIFKQFVKRAASLGIKRCYFSFVFIYPKIVRRSRRLKDFEFIDPVKEKKLKILQEMRDFASQYNIQLYSCSNDHLLSVEGIEKGHCIDGKLLNRLSEQRVSEQYLPTRPDCGCTVSIDIGDYVRTPCKYKCLYCYARP